MAVAPTFVQKAQHNVSNAGAITCPVTITSSGAGNLLVVYIGTQSSSGVITSVTDNVGNTYSLQFSDTTKNASLFCYACLGCTAGATTVTVVSAASPNCFNLDVSVTEANASGTVTWTLDKFAIVGNNAGTTTASSGATATTTQANEIAIAACAGNGATTTAGTAGYTGSITGIRGWSEYLILTATGAQTATFTMSVTGQAQDAGVGTWIATALTIVNATVSFAASASKVNTAFNTHRSTASIAASANTSQSRGVIQRAGTAPIAGSAAATIHGVIGGGIRITIIGRATQNTVFTGLLAVDQIAPITPQATLSFLPLVTHSATVNITGLGDLDPPALTMPVSISADVHIFGLATGSVVAPFEAQAIARFLSTISNPPQVTISGKASFAPNALVARRRTDSFTGKATPHFVATVTGIGTVSGTVIFSGRGAFTPRAFVTNSAQVQIHAGNLLAQTRNADLSISGSASLIISGKSTHDAVSLIQARATGVFSALVTGPSIVNAQSSVTARASFVPKAFQTKSGTVSMAGRGRGTFGASSTVLGNINAAVTFKGVASFAPIPLVSHRGTASFAGQGGLLLSARDLANLNGKVQVPGRAVLTLFPKVTHSVTVSISGRAVGLFPAFSTVLTIVNGALNIHGLASVVPRVLVTRRNTASVAGRATPVFLGGIQGPNLLNSAVFIQGRSNLRPQLLGIPVTSKVAFGGRAILIIAPFILIRVPAAASLRGRGTTNFLAFTQGTTNLNAVLGISGSGFVQANGFMGSAPVVGFIGRASPVFKPSQVQRAVVGISGFATFTPKTPHQALVWISANNLQYKVWQFNLEQMVRVLGTTFTVTSVGLSFQSVALELSSSDAGWGN